MKCAHAENRVCKLCAEMPSDMEVGHFRMVRNALRTRAQLKRQQVQRLDLQVRQWAIGGVARRHAPAAADRLLIQYERELIDARFELKLTLEALMYFEAMPQ